MSSDTPAFATETVLARDLTPGRTIMVLTTSWMEIVTAVEPVSGYVTVTTDQTQSYQWKADEPILALAVDGAR